MIENIIFIAMLALMVTTWIGVYHSHGKMMFAKGRLEGFVECRETYKKLMKEILMERDTKAELTKK